MGVTRGLKRVGILIAVPVIPLICREKSRLQKRNPDRPIDEVLSTPLHSGLTRWYRLVRPVLFAATPDPEIAHIGAVKAGEIFGNILSLKTLVSRTLHQWTICFASVIWGPQQKRQRGTGTAPRLSTTIGGLRLKNPIGVSAGFDKNGKMANFFIHNPIQIGFAEIGSVSALPWEGNPKPRVFRLPEDKAVINRMGLNNDGIAVVVDRLMNDSDLTKKCIGCSGTPIGVNITKTPDSSIEGDDAVEDFRKSFSKLEGMKNLKYVTLNISCPNTAEGKTFEDTSALRSLLSAIQSVESTGKRPKIFLKLAPPPAHASASAGAEIIAVAKEFNVDGLIIANTVADRNFPFLKSSTKILSERGGLSGAPIFGRSTELIRSATAQGMEVIGVGGVASGKDAYKLIENGARAIQLYTSMVFDGPGIFRDVVNGLEREVLLNGYSNLSSMIRERQRMIRGYCDI